MSTELYSGNDYWNVMYLQYPLLLKHATLLQYVLVLDNRALLQFYFFFNTMVVLVIGIVIYRLCLNSLPKYSVRHFGRELRHWLVVYRTMPVYLNLFECIITANAVVKGFLWSSDVERGYLSGNGRRTKKFFFKLVGPLFYTLKSLNSSMAKHFWVLIP